MPAEFKPGIESRAPQTGGTGVRGGESATATARRPHLSETQRPLTPASPVVGKELVLVPRNVAVHKETTPPQSAAAHKNGTAAASRDRKPSGKPEGGDATVLHRATKSSEKGATGATGEAKKGVPPSGDVYTKKTGGAATEGKEGTGKPPKTDKIGSSEAGPKATKGRESGTNTNATEGKKPKDEAPKAKPQEKPYNFDPSATDFYQRLGVSKNATPEEIKRAYRKAAREYHPDNFKGKEAEAAAKKFSNISQAYDMLSDTGKRGFYDLYGDPAELRKQQAKAASQSAAEDARRRQESTRTKFGNNTNDYFRRMHERQGGGGSGASQTREQRARAGYRYSERTYFTEDYFDRMRAQQARQGGGGSGASQTSGVPRDETPFEERLRQQWEKTMRETAASRARAHKRQQRPKASRQEIKDHERQRRQKNKEFLAKEREKHIKERIDELIKRADQKVQKTPFQEAHSKVRTHRLEIATIKDQIDYLKNTKGIRGRKKKIKAAKRELDIARSQLRLQRGIRHAHSPGFSSVARVGEALRDFWES